MENQTQIKLQFLGVDIENVSFNSFKPFDNDDELNLIIHPRVFYPENDNQSFKIIMESKISCKDYFELSLNAIGNFKFNIPVEDSSQKKGLVNVNSVAIMFPYIRAFVSIFTSNVGKSTKPIIIPTRFFSGEIEEFKPETPLITAE